MASKKLKLLFAVSIPIFMAHGLEELWTNFYSVDPHYHALFGAFDGMPVYNATFLLFNLMMWISLITSLLLITDAKWQLRLAFLPMVLYIFELHHLLESRIPRATGLVRRPDWHSLSWWLSMAGND